MDIDYNHFPFKFALNVFFVTAKLCNPSKLQSPRLFFSLSEGISSRWPNLSTITTDQRRSLRSDSSAPVNNESSTERSALQWVKVRIWLEFGASDKYVKKALKLRGLDDAALKVHANYRYYDYFTKKALEYRLYKQLQRDVSTFAIWKELRFRDVTKAVQLQSIVNTMEFKFYERYVQAFHKRVKADYNAMRDPTGVIVARGATEAEMTARTLILVNSRMDEAYAQALLGMTKPGRPGMLLKGKQLEDHVDYEYLQLFQKAKKELNGKQWKDVGDFIEKMRPSP